MTKQHDITWPEKYLEAQGMFGNSMPEDIRIVFEQVIDILQAVDETDYINPTLVANAIMIGQWKLSMLARGMEVMAPDLFQKYGAEAVKEESNNTYNMLRGIVQTSLWKNGISLDGDDGLGGVFSEG